MIPVSLLSVRHILNVTREIDNFFPGMFDYCNIRVYDDEKTDLLKHWDNTFKYISRAKMEGSKVLVHCKMGISRSASVVIAYAMKAYDWDFARAIRHVKEKRSCIKPNKSFVSQLETYQGILDAMKNKEKLQRSKSETNLKSENAKEGKLLPGSEPTPLIQALQHNRNSTYPSSKKEATHSKRICQRPNSSPDISQSASRTISLPKPFSLSLETLVTLVDGSSEQAKLSETTNLSHATNYGHYSISQNQILYLENDSPPPDNEFHDTPLVRDIIFELEQHQEKKKIKDEKAKIHETESLDTGNENRQQKVYRCSAEITHFPFEKTTRVVKPPRNKKDDPLCKQVDSEQKRRLDSSRPENLFFSRQSSWSSIDSACVIGDFQSHNSSCGYECDTKMQRSAHVEDFTQSGFFSYEKYETPWHILGTVKRTKQKIEEERVLGMRSAHQSTNDAKNNNNKILCDIKKSLLIDNLTNHTNKESSSTKQPQKHAKLLQSTSVPSVAIGRNAQSRCRSEEYLFAQSIERMGALRTFLSSHTNDRNNNNQLLSASAPATCSIGLIRENASSENCLKLQQRRNDPKTPIKWENVIKTNKSQHSVGKVKNLKMNFEAKANNLNVKSGCNDKKNCKSLPSSPEAVQVDVSLETNTANTEDIKTLIDRYDGVAKMRNFLSPNVRQRPRSLLETKFNMKTFQPKPLLISHQTIFPKSDDFKRPPIPSQQSPTVKNALVTSNQQNVCLKNTGNFRKIQQQGKTHPLSKLKQRLNTIPAAAYNTM